MNDVAPEAINTAALMDLLAGKYPRDRYALFFDVPDNVGTSSHRRADAVAIGCWKSEGHNIEGFELKASRSDWLRELAQVSKADPFIERCDRWWLVTASPAIAKAEEIPACWGWMAATPKGLRIQKPAPRLPQPEDRRVHRLFMIGILRKLQEDMTKAPEVRLLIESAQKKREEEIQARVTWRMADNEQALERLQKKVAKFEETSGMKLQDWRLGDVGKLARALSDLSTNGATPWNKVAESLAAQETTLRHLLECVALAREQVKERACPST